MYIMKIRTELGAWLEEKGLKTAAEIGVQYGHFAKCILSHWSGHLTMVDAWCHFDSEYTDIANVKNEEHFKIKQQAIESVKEFEGRYSIVQGISPFIASTFKDQSFDLIYIDANHSRNSCLEDIKAWTPKVKKGGIIGGHDYIDEINCFGEFGVKSAVKDFFNKEPDIITQECFPSWFMFI